MNDTNKKNFIKKSSIHVINMNRALKHIQIEVMVNFV